MVLARATTEPQLFVADDYFVAPREQRRAAVEAAKTLVRRRGNFYGWLQNTLLDRHELTRCGCGLVHCR